MLIDLNGEWTLRQRGSDEQTWSATVPGCVHRDLRANSAIPDPYDRDNELRLQWIGEADWSYTRSFEVASAMLDRPRVFLHCEGLDTFAEVFLNGASVGKADNMFRPWEFDVKPHLKPGTNEIEVRFTSVLPYGHERQKEHPLRVIGVPHHRIDGGNWVRKEQCNYGWDWGPMFVTAGIWKPIRLVAPDPARFEHVKVMPRVDAQDRGTVALQVMTEAFRDADLTVTAVIQRDGEVLATIEGPVDNEGRADLTLALKEVERWWPAGMGAQPLYVVTVQLQADGDSVDTRTHRIGFRDLELIQQNDQWGRSFHFRANGRDFFAKGANWIPADTFDANVTTEDLRDLLTSAHDAHMNCIRVWGGGLYERDTFYDLCDELGLCVWQDFCFACAAYPFHEPDFVASVRHEAVANVRRLHSHPSLLIWCGNNENEQIGGLVGDAEGACPWEHYTAVTDDILGGTVKAECPGTPFIPSSGFSPIGDRSNANDDRWGDAHLWAVWHGREPFEWYRTAYHRFCSEFGFQSFPHPATVETYARPEDRNLTSFVMELHQRSPVGNTLIVHYLTSWFQLPTRFEGWVMLSQILQTLGVRYAVEHWRRQRPRCMGALYWQLNDCWPVASWASIDSLHRWKALHYDAKRFFAPLLISGVEDAESGSLAIQVTSDLAQETRGEVVVTAYALSGGDPLTTQRTHVTVPADGDAHVAFDASPYLREPGARHLVFHLAFIVDGATVSENFVLFARPKHMALQDPRIETQTATDADGRTTVTLTAQAPALWTWLEVEGHPDLRWSDNFIPLMPGQPRTLTLTHGTVDEATLAANLKVQSVRDTWAH